MKQLYNKVQQTRGFPCGSAGKESTCNAGDLGSIPGLGQSPGEGKGYPLQYSGLQNSLDKRTWYAHIHLFNRYLLSSYCVLGEGNGTPLQYSCLEYPMDRGTWQGAVHSVTKSWTQMKQLSIHTLLEFSTISTINIGLPLWLR